MTRFARAKGSKASNEKLPNEATPWHLMKQQLEENKHETPLEKKLSAKELLKDEKDTYNINKNNEWAEFDDNKSNLSNNTKKHKYKNSLSNKNLMENFQTNTNHISKTKIKELKKTEDTEVRTTDSKKNKFFNKKKEDIDNLPSHDKESNISQNNDPNFIMLSKRQKRNQKRKLVNNMANNDSKRFKTDTSHNKTKEERIKNKEEYKRRKPDNIATKIMINGIEIEVVKYDGFPIKKEDADRLTELKQKLILKGIPKSEVERVMKLERRKAEKALVRAKKVVCFHCRKSGHNLSDCPELGCEENNAGICFKCGSTEHTHYECKVNKDYRYAKCFICREQGHIAMQCPDNPKGVYPHGGCCKVCGAVTHLKKDCPDLIKAKEDNTITVEKINNTAVESLQVNKKEKDESSAMPKKIIKF